MAAVVNSAQKILLAATTRATNLPSARIFLTPTAPAFRVTAAGANDPASITLTATLIDLEGVVSFSCAGGTLTSTATTATLTYANMSAASATITATVTANGQPYSTTYTITKVLDGANGVNAAFVTISTPYQAFTRTNTASAFAPASTTLTATPFGGAATYQWQYWTGSAWTNVAAGGTSAAYAVASGDFSSARTYRVQATIGGAVYTDEITLVQLTGGTNGVNPIVGLLTNEAATLAADSAGTVASFAAAGGTFKVYEGITDKTGTAGPVTYSVAAQTDCTVAITSAGVYSVSAMSADSASATLQAVYGGVTLQKTLSLAKAKAGLKGNTGDAGMSVATVQIFQRSASATPLALPSATTTFTFATGALAGLNNGWTTTLSVADPAKPYLQSSLASARGAGASDDIASNEWAGVVVLTQDGQAGAPGLNGATVRIYQRTASAAAPALPSAAVTYTFATGALTGLNNGWSGTMPAVSAGAFLHTSHATAAATTATDSIANTEWAASQLLYDAAAIIAAQAAADAANAKADAITADGILDRSEKVDLLSDIAAANARYTQLTGQASTMGVSFAAFTAARDARDAYLASLDDAGQPAWNDVTQNTAIDRPTYRTKFTDYNREEMALLNAIVTKAANASAELTLNQYGITIQGNQLKKTGGTAETWDASAWSSQGYPAAYASATPMVYGNYAFGLDTEPTGNHHISTIDRAIYFREDGNVWYAESGNYGAMSIATTYTPGQDVFTVDYDGTTVRYRKNQTVIRSVVVTTTAPLFFDSSFFTDGSSLKSVRFAPLSSNNYNDIGGPGKPEPYATVGAPAGTPVAGTAAETVAQTVNNINNPFSVSLPATLGGTGYANAPAWVLYGRLTPTVAGGNGTVTVTWSINVFEGEVRLQPVLVNSMDVYGRATNAGASATVTCRVDDSTGRTKNAITSVSGSHGNPP